MAANGPRASLPPFATTEPDPHTGVSAVPTIFTGPTPHSQRVVSSFSERLEAAIWASMACERGTTRDAHGLGTMIPSPRISDHQSGGRFVTSRASKALAAIRCHLRVPTIAKTLARAPASSAA